MGVQKIGLEAILDMANFNKGMGQYNQGVDDMSGKTKGLAGIFGGVGKAIAGVGIAAAGLAIGGVAALTKGLASTIGPASDLNESLNKVMVVFGKKSGTQITNWSKTAAKSMGLSQRQALEAAGTYGNLFTSMGLTNKASTEMSTQLVQLAADLGSFNNIPIDVALEKLRAGLTGESEPLKTLGININETILKNKALEMGLIDTTKEALDPATKALAAYALMMEQSGNAQGDFARTTDGLANQQKILQAQLEDTKAKIGTALIPGLQTLSSALINTLGSPEVQATLKHITDWLKKNLPTAITGAITFLTNAYNGVRGILEELGLVAPRLVKGAGATAGQAAGPPSKFVPLEEPTGGTRAVPDLGKQVVQGFGETLTAETEAELEAANQALIPVINKWLYETIEVPFRESLDKLPTLSDKLKELDLPDWFREVGTAIDGVLTKLGEFITKMRGLPSRGELPTWVVGRSPPPMAEWLQAIGGAAGQATAGIQTVSGTVRGMPAMTAPRTAAGRTVQMTTIGGDTIIQNIADPATYVLAMAIVNDKKRERFATAMGVG